MTNIATSDDIGSRGEALFHALITDYDGQDGPLFRPCHLGGKFPTLDFYVELVGTMHPRFFFAQVKATAQGDTPDATGDFQSAGFGKTEIGDRMLRFPAPTYLIGIDERLACGFIVSVNKGPPRRYSSLSTHHVLNQKNRELLWNEVREFWDNRDMTLRNSRFGR